MKSDFVAITSHELRTPLSGIRGLRRHAAASRKRPHGRSARRVPGHRAHADRSVDPSGRRSPAWSPGRRQASWSLEPTEVEVRQLLEQVTNGLGEAAASVRIEERDRRPGSDGGRPQPSDPGPHEPRAQRRQVLAGRCDGGASLDERRRRGRSSFDVVDRGAGIPESEVGADLRAVPPARRAASPTRKGSAWACTSSKLLTQAMGGWIDRHLRRRRGLHLHGHPPVGSDPFQHLLDRPHQRTSD